MRNKSLYSKKTNSSGLKLETITNYYGLIVYHSAVTNGATHDFTLHKMNSFTNTLQGKYVLGDSGYIGNDKNILARIKLNELPPEKRKDENYMRKMYYFNDTQSKLRMVVEDMYGRACSIFKWINNSPYSHIHFTKMIMEMALPLVNFHILRYPLKKRYNISDGIMTLEEYELLKLRDELFESMNKVKGNSIYIDNYTSKYINYIIKLNSFQTKREKERKEKSEISSFPEPKTIQKKIKEKREIKIKEKKSQSITLTPTQTIHKEVLQQLKQNKMLSSDCIIVYMDYLKKLYAAKANSFLFDTFFFEKMDQNNNQKKSYLKNKVNACATKDKVIIVKFKNSHFILYVIHFGNEKVSSLESEGNNSSTISIIIFDSLNATKEIDKKDSVKLRNLINRIQNRKKQLDQNYEIVKYKDIHIDIVKTCQQRNGIDCGVFCCFYISKILETEPSTLEEFKNIAIDNSVINFRNKMYDDIVNLKDELD